MSNKFNVGDSVTWSSGSGEATGTIKEKITRDKTVNGQTISASESDPRYLVENDNTGNVTGHKPETLSAAESSSHSKSSSGDKFEPGDRVKWNTAQGETTGKVKKKLTEDTSIKDFDVKASKDNPKYLVESESTGKEAAHKPESLKKA